MKSKKTPAPWAVWHDEFVIAKGKNANELLNVADCAVSNNGAADAVFIVKACNNYERLKADRDKLAADLLTLVEIASTANLPRYVRDAAHHARATLNKLKRAGV